MADKDPNEPVSLKLVLKNIHTNDEDSGKPGEHWVVKSVIGAEQDSSSVRKSKRKRRSSDKVREAASSTRIKHENDGGAVDDEPPKKRRKLDQTDVLTQNTNTQPTDDSIRTSKRRRNPSKKSADAASEEPAVTPATKKRKRTSTPASKPKKKIASPKTTKAATATATVVNMSASPTAAALAAAQNKKPMALYKVISNMIKQLIQMDNQSIFYDPVNDDIAPGYSKVVKYPMCFITMRERLTKRQYKTLAIAQMDLKLIFTNAMLYNPSGSIYYTEAARLMDEAKKLVLHYKSKLDPQDWGTEDPLFNHKPPAPLLANDSPARPSPRDRTASSSLPTSSTTTASGAQGASPASAAASPHPPVVAQRPRSTRYKTQSIHTIDQDPSLSLGTSAQAKAKSSGSQSGTPAGSGSQRKRRRESPSRVATQKMTTVLKAPQTPKAHSVAASSAALQASAVTYGHVAPLSELPPGVAITTNKIVPAQPMRRYLSVAPGLLPPSVSAPPAVTLPDDRTPFKYQMQTLLLPWSIDPNHYHHHDPVATSPSSTTTATSTTLCGYRNLVANYVDSQPHTPSSPVAVGAPHSLVSEPTSLSVEPSSDTLHYGSLAAMQSAHAFLATLADGSFANKARHTSASSAGVVGHHFSPPLLTTSQTALLNPAIQHLLADLTPDHQPKHSITSTELAQLAQSPVLLSAAQHNHRHEPSLPWLLDPSALLHVHTNNNNNVNIRQSGNSYSNSSSGSSSNNIINQSTTTTTAAHVTMLETNVDVMHSLCKKQMERYDNEPTNLELLLASSVGTSLATLCSDSRFCASSLLSSSAITTAKQNIQQQILNTRAQ